MGGMCTHVTTFMVCVNSHVQAHQFFEPFVRVTQHMSKVTCPVQQTIWLNMITAFVFTAIDIGGYTWQTCNEVHCIIIHIAPVVFFVDALSICLCKTGFSLHSQYTYRKHRHWVCGNWK